MDMLTIRKMDMKVAQQAETWRQYHRLSSHQMASERGKALVEYMEAQNDEINAYRVSLGWDPVPSVSDRLLTSVS